MRFGQGMLAIASGVVVFVLLASAGIGAAGSLDSPGAPNAFASYTLEDIYSRLNKGTAGTQGVFTEPNAGPTAGTMHTLNDIMGKAPVTDDTNGASAGDVLSGKTYWGLTSGGWGPRTGALATKTVDNTTVNQAAGYYSAFNLSNVDTDLATGNIKSGVNIFGVSGKTDVVDTAGATAAAGDMVSGKTAYVNGGLVTGSAAAGANVTGANGSKTFTIPVGIYTGSKTATAGDTNLVTGNIKSGVSIFGVSGKPEVVDTAGATATAGDLLSGKTAYVGGSAVTGTLTTRTLSSANDTIEAGYYAATTLSAVDADLAAGNIKSGANVFGVVGTYVGSVSAAVPRTGQTATEPFAAPAGSDGALQKGVAWPIPRFTDNGNGTVTDNLTGLMWTQDANLAGAKNWNDALTYCNMTMNAGAGTYGHTDWRLPNIFELTSLIDYRWVTPVICNTIGNAKLSAGDPFTNVQSNYYWTSSTTSFDPNAAWLIRLDMGQTSPAYKTDARFVWPVRGGQ